MLFFALLVVLTAVIALARRSADWRSHMRLAMAISLVAVGADHWLNTERYLAMMPPWVPLHLEMVLFTGAAEIAGAVGLLTRRFRSAAGLALAVYFVAVFPANIHNALNGLSVDGLPQAAWYYWARLPFQPLAIWWALYSAELIRWPLRSRVSRTSGSAAPGSA
jgi:uncharacterized membrane protein